MADSQEVFVVVVEGKVIGEAGDFIAALKVLGDWMLLPEQMERTENGTFPENTEGHIALVVAKTKIQPVADGKREVRTSVFLPTRSAQEGQ